MEPRPKKQEIHTIQSSLQKRPATRNNLDKETLATDRVCCRSTIHAQVRVLGKFLHGTPQISRKAIAASNTRHLKEELQQLTSSTCPHRATPRSACHPPPTTGFTEMIQLPMATRNPKKQSIPSIATKAAQSGTGWLQEQTLEARERSSNCGCEENPQKS